MAPLKVTISGIDGSGKSTSASAVSRRLARDGLVVVHPLRRAYVDRPGRAREYFGDPIHAVVDRTHRGFDRLGSRTAVGLVNVAYARVWRSVEAWAVARYRPDVVLSGRCSVLDGAAYAPFYFGATRALDPARRLATSARIGGAAPPDLRFLLEVDGPVAHARILDRIAKERAVGVDDRQKWTHMHETPDELTAIGRELARCAVALPDPVIRLDAGQPQDAVVEAIVHAVRAAHRRRATLSDAPA